MGTACKSALLDEARGGDCTDPSDDSLGSGASPSFSRMVVNHLVDVSRRQCINPNPLPALPIELVLLIFEYAARDSKSTASSLSLVSRFARDIVLPLLFRSLVLNSRATVHLLTKFLTARQSIANYVRELWMRQGIDQDISIVLSCPRIERLAITPTCFSALFKSDGILSLNHLPEIRPPTPHELLLFPGYVRWDNLIFGASGDYLLSFLQGLTHLWLTQQSQLYSLLKCGEAVAGLSRLTHLASPAEYTRIEIILGVLNSFPKLQMFVMLPQRNRDPWTREGWAGTDYDYPFRNFRTACLDELDKRLCFVELDQVLLLDRTFLGFRILDGCLSNTSIAYILSVILAIRLFADSHSVHCNRHLSWVRLEAGLVYSILRLFDRWLSVRSLPFSYHDSWLVDHEGP
ncbi:hypothetical protein ACEPAG_2857 [Sanghuangporus baumii]